MNPMPSAGRPTLYVVTTHPRDLPTSFIRAHVERLPADVVPVHGYIPMIGDRPVLSESRVVRSFQKLDRMIRRLPWDYEITRGYSQLFRNRPGAVLAEYGPTGARVAAGCARAGVPLIVHFHGHDAGVRSVLAEHDNYRELFKAAAAIVGVSKAMCARLRDLGAPAGKVHFNPYGVDCEAFRVGTAETAPTMLAVGRFVEKKAPHLTILAFAQVHRAHPGARLRMIGDGPLMGACRDLVEGLHLQDAVTFLGEQDGDVIAAEMRRARCFVQHSVEAQNGDSEGTPVAILEAGASGLPVVSTRHAGIVDVVVEGETGILVPERDIQGMARAMTRLVADSELARRMGCAARNRIETRYTMQRHIDHLWAIIEAAIERRPVLEPVDDEGLTRVQAVASRNPEPSPDDARARDVQTLRARHDAVPVR
jgi:glycosyltransferase involved in cell wall biosynthesis